MKKEEKKICFAASSGGHFEQLLMLKPLMEEYESFIVTEKTDYKAKVPGERIYFQKQINRKELLLIPKLIMNTVKALGIIIKEKPDVIITTGVLAIVPLCVVAKLFRKKIIYIESFAKIKDSTQTGKFLYKFADQFYVQWKTMLEVYPDAIYLGGIY